MKHVFFFFFFFFFFFLLLLLLFNGRYFPAKIKTITVSVAPEISWLTSQRIHIIKPTRRTNFSNLFLE